MSCELVAPSMPTQLAEYPGFACTAGTFHVALANVSLPVLAMRA
jgi:hypothetical protein